MPPDQQRHPSDTDTDGDQHIPVLAGRIGEILAPAFEVDSPVVVDATLGLGGHALYLLRAHPQLRVIGIDRDPAAIDHATRRISAAGYADRLVTAHTIYDDLDTVVSQAGAVAPDGTVDAVFFDLGVSSMQLDRADRGFAYAADAPLDMRMDSTTGITAADVLNSYDEADLARILREYGDERFARRIAAAVVKRRRHTLLRSSTELVELLRKAIPAATQRTGGHPAKRTFQALRIEVNDELGALRRAIPAALAVLRCGGRIAALSYHSGEDRIVKRAIAPMTLSTTPLDLPVELEGHEPTFRWIAKGAERPSETETANNPRAASARLRVAERIRPGQ